jgi:chromosome segregation ATPase
MRFAFLTVAILVITHGTAQAQDLGAAAAKEKQRRAKTGAAGKAYTEDDLQRAAAKRATEGEPASESGAPDSKPAGAAEAVVPAASAAPEPPDDSAAIQEAKKARGRKYKVQLDGLNAQLRAAQRNLKMAEDDAHMVETHPWTLAASLEEARARLAAARQRVQELKDQIDEVETAARREAIPPGYLR